MRRHFLKMLAAAALPLPAMAQAYPQRAIRMVVPYAPGGGTDVIARIVAQELTDRLKQPVVVDNQPGANGNIGFGAVARAKPDGYTLTMMTSSLVPNSFLYDNAPNPSRDLAPIIGVAGFHTALVARQSLDAKDLPSLIALARKAGRPLTVSSAGVGSAGHLAAAVFMKSTGVQLEHVSYKGAGPALQDVVAGHVDLVFDNPVTSAQFIKTGQLKVFGLSDANPSSVLPSVRPIAETVPGYESSGWFAIGAPAGLPADVRQILQKHIAELLLEGKVRTRLIEMGNVITATPSDQMAAIIQREMTTYGALLRGLDLK